MEAHDKAVAQIATSVGKFYARKEAFRIYHGSTNSTRQSQLQRDKMVDTSGLNHVIRIDITSKTALVEPNVPMDAFVEATLKHGLVAPVVMEFPGITVGGGFAGSSGESSSFRYGLFERSINRVEMILANGEIAQASANENSDLFHGAASSYGTLGVLTLLEVQLIDAKTYVELTYIPVTSITHTLREIEKATSDPTTEYLDGIMYSPTNGVVCAGRLTNTLSPSTKIQTFTKPSDPWFYLHALSLLSSSSSHSNNQQPITEAIPLESYLFRYDRGGFWVARYAFTYFLTPFNRITRYVLDHFMHTRTMNHAFHRSGLSSQYIIQDIAIPYAYVEEFMSYLVETFNQYPLWLCPIKKSGMADLSKTPLKTLETDKGNKPMGEFTLNFGIWGPGPKERDAFVAANRALEKKTQELGGQKCLYAHTYYTEDEFYEVYNRRDYEALREKYHAGYLPSVYDKVKVDLSREKGKVRYDEWRERLREGVKKVWPLQGLYGVYCVVRGGDYLLPRTEKKLGKVE